MGGGCRRERLVGGGNVLVGIGKCLSLGLRFGICGVRICAERWVLRMGCVGGGLSRSK